MEQKFYEYDALIHEVPDNGGAYVIFPWNIREEFGKGRIKVHAEFDGIPYDGSIVNRERRKRECMLYNRAPEGHPQAAEKRRWRQCACCDPGEVKEIFAELFDYSERGIEYGI